MRVLYLHGGGYVHPLTRDYWRLVRALSAAPAEVVVPAYPLAPAAHVDDVVPRLVDLARELGDLPLVVVGDSAGGALSLVLARHLRPAVELLVERAQRSDDAVLTVHERTAMFHVWMTRFVPEGAQTRRVLQDQVRAAERLAEPRRR